MRDPRPRRLVGARPLLHRDSKPGGTAKGTSARPKTRTRVLFRTLMSARSEKSPGSEYGIRGERTHGIVRAGQAADQTSSGSAGAPPAFAVAGGAPALPA